MLTLSHSANPAFSIADPIPCPFALSNPRGGIRRLSWPLRKRGSAGGGSASIQEANLAEITPANGASYPDSPLGTAQLFRSDLLVEVTCIDSGGWDHHENSPIFLPQSLSELASFVAAFEQGILIRFMLFTHRVKATLDISDKEKRLSEAGGC